MDVYLTDLQDPSGLRAAGGRLNSAIERTVATRAYGSWTMFVKAFQNTIRVFSHRRSLGFSWRRGVLSWLRNAALARACVQVYVSGRARLSDLPTQLKAGQHSFVLMGFRRDWIGGVV
jgi:hypothetical protein